MKKVFSSKYQPLESQIETLIKEFEYLGEKLDNGNRNTIKLFKVGEEIFNIKAFKKPNLLNRLIYRFFRSSKAQRSFEYAHHLLDNEILTPYPVAYFEDKKGLFFGKSYYVSRHLDYDLTYRELIKNSAYVGDEGLLSAFAKFTFDLHEKGIHFLDHSPGNTLIKFNDDQPNFYLVDLNRMNFGVLDFNTRMKNFARLSPIKEQVAIMAKTYAALIHREETEVFNVMWMYISTFQNKFQRKKRLKKRYKFWG